MSSTATRQHKLSNPFLLQESQVQRTGSSLIGPCNGLQLAIHWVCMYLPSLWSCQYCSLEQNILLYCPPTLTTITIIRLYIIRLYCRVQAVHNSVYHPGCYLVAGIPRQKEEIETFATARKCFSY